MHQHEDKVLLVLTLLIGAIVGLVIVAFILLTENLGARMYPAGGAPWRRLAVPVAGSLITGYLLFRYFPGARGSGIPKTKAALFLHSGVIHLRTVLGKYWCASVSLASGIALGHEGPSIQVGAGIASAGLISTLFVKLLLWLRKRFTQMPAGTARSSLLPEACSLGFRVCLSRQSSA